MNKHGKIQLTLLLVIILNSTLVFAQISQQGPNSNVQRETEPVLRYVSDPFDVEYDISDVIEKAKKLNYLIKINDDIINENNFRSNKSLIIDSQIILNNTTNEIFFIENINDSYNFRVFGKKFTGNPYLLLTYFVPQNKSIDTYEAGSLVLQELKMIGIATKTTKINFKKEYVNPTVPTFEIPNQVSSFLISNSISILIIIALIIIIAIIFTIKKRHKT